MNTKIDLYYTANQHPIKEINFDSLGGGLNLRDSEYRLKPNESPECVNLWWQDGVLQSRPGQQRANFSVEQTDSSGRAVTYTYGRGYAVSADTFFGATFAHIGGALWYITYGSDNSADAERHLIVHRLASGVPRNAGTFFRFDDYLFYKNRGAFFRISHQGSTMTPFACDAIALDAEGVYIPTTVINASPDDGSGDLYQPENRLTGKKKITYNAAATEKEIALVGDGEQNTFSLNLTTLERNCFAHIARVEIDGNYQSPALYAFDGASIAFTTAPERAANIIVTVALRVQTYHLPVTNINAVESVMVDGSERTDYTANLTNGTITFFNNPPPVTVPPTNNTVEIIYRKSNPDAYNSVMQCDTAAVYGSGNQLCIVAGGCPAQPNAVFWSGNTSYGLDPTYWPMSYYNLVGDTEDYVTGFGKQYSELIVFKARSVGKLNGSFEDVDGRTSISLTYERINDEIGCDIPGSIQLIENNLVFANTEGGNYNGGIFLIQSSSAAYENNIIRISGKIDGSETRPGLIRDLSAAGEGPVSSHDDGKRYYLAVNGHVWIWDYSISTVTNPVWWYWTGFDPDVWWQKQGVNYFLRTYQEGVSATVDATSITRLVPRAFDDYGEAIRKVYQFPVQNFGSYDRLKDVLYALFSVSGETEQNTKVTWQNDYEARDDLTNLVSHGSASLAPRDLSYRDLSVNNFAATFRRRPMCRHVRHFSMRLENSEAGKDLSILSAQIQYRFLGRDR